MNEAAFDAQTLLGLFRKCCTFADLQRRHQLVAAALFYIRSGVWESMFDLTRRLSCVWFDRRLTRRNQALERKSIEKLKAAFSYDKLSPDTSDAERGNAACDAPRRLRDAERPGRRYHAERERSELMVSKPASSRLKPVPQKATRAVSRTGVSREAFDLLLIFLRKKSKRH